MPYFEVETITYGTRRWRIEADDEESARAAWQLADQEMLPHDVRTLTDGWIDEEEISQVTPIAEDEPDDNDHPPAADT